MARLICADPACGVAVSRADPVCWNCGTSLLEDGATVEAPAGPVQAPADTIQAPVPEAGQRPAASSAGGTVDRCPTCGADVPDSRHLVCLECMTELHPAGPLTAAPGTPGAEGRDSYATAREHSDTKLTVTFAFGAIELSVGQEVLLGRDASDRRLASLHDKDNVSRRHATIGLTPRGAWIRDEKSTNGTFVDGRRVTAGEAAELAGGEELRLASDVRATVRLSHRGEAGDG
jgi:hypothetical protein